MMVMSEWISPADVALLAKCSKRAVNKAISSNGMFRGSQLEIRETTGGREINPISLPKDLQIEWAKRNLSEGLPHPVDGIPVQESSAIHTQKSSGSLSGRLNGRNKRQCKCGRIQQVRSADRTIAGSILGSAVGLDRCAGS